MMQPHFLCNSLNYGKLAAQIFFNVTVFCYLRVRNKEDKNMKKIVIIIIAILTGINANAQWSKTLIKGDELKETVDRTMYNFRSNNGDSFWFISNETCINITTNRGIFDFDYDDYCHQVLQFVKIGFYVNGELVEKTNCLDTTFRVSDSGTTAWVYGIEGDPNLSSRIIDHLRNKGEVRIIAYLYDETEYDVTIPMISE